MANYLDSWGDKGRTVACVDSKCPYCGAVQRNSVPLNRINRPVVVDCDPDVGGCDRWYAVTVRVTVTVQEASIVEVES